MPTTPVRLPRYQLQDDRVTVISRVLHLHDNQRQMLPLQYRNDGSGNEVLGTLPRSNVYHSCRPAASRSLETIALTSSCAYEGSFVDIDTISLFRRRNGSGHADCSRDCYARILSNRVGKASV